MAKLFSQTNSPIDVLKAYLSTLTIGAYKGGGDIPSFNGADYNIKQCYLAGSITELVQEFGQETVLIWAAMLMKKRIVVYGENIVRVLQIVRTLPILGE